MHAPGQPVIQTFVPEHSSAALPRHRPSLQGVAFRTNPKAQVTGCRWGATQQGLPLHPPAAGHSGHSPQHGPSGQRGACTPTSQPPVLANFPRTMQTIAEQSCGAQLLLKAQDPRSSPEPGAGPAEIALTAGTAEEQPAPRAQDSSVPCLEHEQRAETAAGAGGRPRGLERHALGGSGRPVPSTGVSPPRPVPNARSRCTHFRGKFLGCFLCSLFSAWLLPSSCSFTGQNRWLLGWGGLCPGEGPQVVADCPVLGFEVGALCLRLSPQRIRFSWFSAQRVLLSRPGSCCGIESPLSLAHPVVEESGFPRLSLRVLIRGGVV